MTLDLLILPLPTARSSALCPVSMCRQLRKTAPVRSRWGGHGEARHGPRGGEQLVHLDLELSEALFQPLELGCAAKQTQVGSACYY